MFAIEKSILEILIHQLMVKLIKLNDWKHSNKDKNQNNSHWIYLPVHNWNGTDFGVFAPANANSKRQSIWNLNLGRFQHRFWLVFWKSNPNKCERITNELSHEYKSRQILCINLIEMFFFHFHLIIAKFTVCHEWKARKNNKISNDLSSCFFNFDAWLCG